MSAGQNSAHLIPQKDFLFNLPRPCEINLGPVYQKKITLRAVVPLTRPKKRFSMSAAFCLRSHSRHVGTGHFLALRRATVSLSQKVGGPVSVTGGLQNSPGGKESGCWLKFSAGNITQHSQQRCINKKQSRAESSLQSSAARGPE